MVPFAPQPYTTQIFQVLDLTLFGVLKTRGQYQLPLEDDTGSVRFIRKVSHDFGITVVEPNIWGAFRGIGIKYSVVDAVQRVSFDKMTLRESEGLKELWDIDFPVGNLSPRRQSSKFGWTDEPESNGMEPSSSNFSDGPGIYSGQQKIRKSGILV
jgi:hypothetical protein